MNHRLATGYDFKAVFDLYMDDGANPYLTFDPMSEQDFVPVYNELVNSNTLYVVESDKRIVATYRLIPKSARQSHIVYLGSFTIKSGLQGKGIGRKVLEGIKAKVISDGKVRLELTVDVNNERAIHLYKSMGFEIEGTVKKSYRLASTGLYYDEYLMAFTI